MRTSILSIFLLGLVVASVPSSVFAGDAMSSSSDSQFEPNLITTPPPLYSATPRLHEAQKKVAPTAKKPLPLEVKRTRAKVQGHIVVKHHPQLPHPKTRHKHVYPCKKPHVHTHAITKKNVLFTSLKRHHHLSQCVVYPGSLKSNIQRIASQYGWSRVVWTLPQDYRWVGKTRISGHSLSSILGKLLKDYPLQAQLYQGNHVLVITPRTLQ